MSLFLRGIAAVLGVAHNTRRGASSCVLPCAVGEADAPRSRKRPGIACVTGGAVLPIVAQVPSQVPGIEVLASTTYLFRPCKCNTKPTLAAGKKARRRSSPSEGSTVVDGGSMASRPISTYGHLERQDPWDTSRLVVAVLLLLSFPTACATRGNLHQLGRCVRLYESPQSNIIFLGI